LQGSVSRGKEVQITFKSYRDLEVWQKAMDLVVECYRITNKLPRSELYGLTSQLRRAAVSVPSNIAEGRERQHTKEFVQHLAIAYGSLAESETHLQIAQRLNYLDSSQVRQVLEKTSEVGRMLNGLRRSLGKV
jgi:four helix bundle protein